MGGLVMVKKIILLITGILIVFLTGCIDFNTDKGMKKNSFEGNLYEKEEKLVEGFKENYEPIDIVISSIGDILIHNTLYMAAYNSEANTYDFKPQFKKVKPFLEKSDLTVANLEGTLAGGEEGYSGYPLFNAPDNLIEALKFCGIDAITAANNHRLDKGTKGFYRTIEVVRNSGLDIIGVKKVVEDKSYIIKNIKGVKVALVNYTYETAEQSGYKTLNDIVVPKELEDKIDSFNKGNLEKDLKVMKERIEYIKKEGADLIIFFMHWGNEYERVPDKLQKALAQKLCDYGVDIIIGGHPHVIQPAEYIYSNISLKETFVLYSQGNFISDQREETIKNKYSEDGIITELYIRKDVNNKKTYLKEVRFIPTWVNKETGSGKYFYEVVPLLEDIRDSSIKEKYNYYDSTLKRMENSFKRTSDHIYSFIEKKSIEVFKSKELNE